MDAKELLQREQIFYDLRWARTSLSKRDRERIEFTCNAVPGDCVTILDVGAGDGSLSIELVHRGKNVSAVDLSAVALSRIPVPGYCESADHLSMPDRSFDMVLSTEMLEHLPEACYQRAIEEFSRVAARYILITVPNRELLGEHLSVCGNCGHRFHIWGHARRYAPKDLLGLFPGFSLRRLSEFGHKEPYYNPLLSLAKRSVAGAWAWDEDSPCPNCRQRKRKPSSLPLLARILDSINHRLWGRFFSRKAWLLALYSRKN